uniref:Protein kinase domain-containing protein n=1 Tax=Psilocybe cubensis TaxID=181762 RepID=A0A8H8CJE6_PSICU
MPPPHIQVVCTEDEVVEAVSPISLTITRRRSHTIDFGPNLTIPGRVSPQISRSTPQLRLQLSIPAAATQKLGLDINSSVSQEETPQSECGPETPVSTTSPGVAKVVDLTKDITTTSVYAVAHGGLSDIYTGNWHRTSSDTGETEVIAVAIKVLRILARKDHDGANARKKLNKEVYVWHRLEHPNIVKLFGTSYHMSGRPAMIMQWYKNGSAAEYLEKINPEADRLRLILDVARGLAYLHTHSPAIVHADLKANNILITDEGRAAICDFGLSEVVEDLNRPTGYTLSTPNVGPLRWRAPEFLENDGPAVFTSDVWSFGCTALELLTDAMPYKHCKGDYQVIKSMQEGVKPCLADDPHFQKLDERVKNLLDDCWSFNPSERPCMTHVQAQLEAIYSLS